jgi:caffeoyl-CoA O-methyltransferase
MISIVKEELGNYAERYTSAEPALLTALSRFTWDNMAYPQMISSRTSGRFLTFVCQMLQARNALEIGMFTGYSALNIAEGLTADGHLLTCDISHELEKIARSYFEQSPYGNKISIRIQDAHATIAEINHELDFVFIDADKTSYKDYYDAVLPKLRRGGVIIADNCLWSGKVLHPSDEDSEAIHKFNEFVSRDERVRNVILTVRDGLNMIIKN